MTIDQQRLCAPTNQIAGPAMLCGQQGTSHGSQLKSSIKAR